MECTQLETVGPSDLVAAELAGFPCQPTCCAPNIWKNWFLQNMDRKNGKLVVSLVDQ